MLLRLRNLYLCWYASWGYLLPRMFMCLVLAFGAVGCKSRAANAAAKVGDAVAGAPINPGKPAGSLGDALKERAHLKARLAANEATVTELQTQRYRTLLHIVSAIAILGMLGFAAAAWFIPTGRKLFAAGVAACFTVLVLSQLVVVILPYLVWIGLAILLAGIAALVYRWHKD